MRKIRNTVLAFSALALLLAGTAQAAPFAYADDPGDAMDTRASMDIVAVRYDVRQVNKSGPPSLVVEMELAAPPEGQLVSYEIRSQVEGCGYFQASYQPGTIWAAATGAGTASFFMECGSPADPTGSSATLLYTQFRIDGNTLRWSAAMDSIPKELRSGVTFSELRAFTQIAEPFMGIFGSGNDLPLPMDEASTDKTWSY